MSHLNRTGLVFCAFALTALPVFAQKGEDRPRERQAPQAEARHPHLREILMRLFDRNHDGRLDARERQVAVRILERVIARLRDGAGPPGQRDGGRERPRLRDGRGGADDRGADTGPMRKRMMPRDGAGPGAPRDGGGPPDGAPRGRGRGRMGPPQGGADATRPDAPPAQGDDLGPPRGMRRMGLRFGAPR